MVLKQTNKKIEEYVTYKTAEYLSDNKWEIISCNPPGSHGGLCLLDKDRSKGGIVPDIIAKKGNNIIIIEAKPFFNSGVARDIDKLETINYNHILNLAQRLKLSDDWLINWQNYVQKAVALKTIEANEIIKISRSYIIFIVNEVSEKIKIIIGNAAVIKKLI